MEENENVEQQVIETSNEETITEDNSNNNDTIGNIREEYKQEGEKIIDPKTASPEEVQKRINYLYKQFRTSNERSSQLEKIAAEQYKVIEDLQKGVGAVVDHLQTNKITETETQLKAQLKTAYEAGDTNSLVEIQDKLAEIKAQKLNLKKIEKPKVEAHKVQQEQPIYDPEFRYEGRDVVEAWQEERDANGQLLRPWAFPKSANDLDFLEAEAVAGKIFSNPQYQHLSMEEKLDMVDKRMGTKKTNGGQTVLGSGNLTPARKTAKITLTPEMQKIAIRTKFGGSKARTDADHIEAYRQQLEKVKQSKRS